MIFVITRVTGVMIEQHSSTSDLLDGLVLAWQEQREQGQDIPILELCRDHPELTAELEQRIQLLRRFEKLITLPYPASVSGTDGDECTRLPPGYEFIGILGKGGMGIVCKVRNVALNRIEALKMIRAGIFAGPRELARFRFEAEAAAGLDHSNIVPVYGVGEWEGGPFLTMKYVDGDSLSHRPLVTATDSATLLAKTARAVHYAHQRGILHRDLKPGNILIDAKDEPYVTDFGVARRLDGARSITQTGEFVGTVAYMSPEQARAEANLTVASDIYALGAILYHMLTGRDAFDGLNPIEILKQVEEIPPTAPRAINPKADQDLEAVCLKCMEKDPANRYASAEVLAEDLDRYLRGESVVARPPGLGDWLRQLWRTQLPPDPDTTRPVMMWYGLIMLTTHATTFGLALAGRSAAWVWLVQGGCWLTTWLVIWYCQARWFRRLPAHERLAMMVACGHLLANVSLALAFVPLSLSAPAREALALYPALAALSGFAFFVVGVTHWSRFFLFGFGLIALAPVMSIWPAAAPLTYGAAVAACLGYWAFAVRTRASR
jgi:eukaryotic-like serine/threonine-protein kinase